MKLLGIFVILLGSASFAFAGTTSPEIDGNTATAAVALVGGGLLVLRGKRKK
jgi:hypothetical protein